MANQSEKPSGPPTQVPYGFVQPLYQPQPPLGAQNDFILASLARIEAELDLILKGQARLLELVAQIPAKYSPEPCPPHDFPKVFVGRKGQKPGPRLCQKCGQVEEGPPPW